MAGFPHILFWRDNSIFLAEDFLNSEHVHIFNLRNKLVKVTKHAQNSNLDLRFMAGCGRAPTSSGKRAKIIKIYYIDVILDQPFLRGPHLITTKAGLMGLWPRSL